MCDRVSYHDVGYNVCVIRNVIYRCDALNSTTNAYDLNILLSINVIMQHKD